METSTTDGDVTITEAAVIISADLLWWGSDRVPEMLRRINARYGVAEDAILLHGTHTHSGPQTSGLFTSYLGPLEVGYVEWMEHQVIEGIEAAWKQAEPVRMEQGIGHSPLAINRRGVVKSPAETGPVDYELRVIRFVKEDGGTKGLLTHYACHPVISKDNSVSSEYTGVAMEIVEQTSGDGVVAAFLQGTCGDINPGDGERVIRGNNETVMQVGQAFAQRVIDTLNQPMKPLSPCRLKWSKTRVQLPLAPLPDREQLEITALSQGVAGEWSRIMLNRWDSLAPYLTMELIVLRLADSLSFIGMNAEVVVEYGLYIKSLTDGCVLPIGYTNGMFGYVPTARQLLEGGYETRASTVYFAMASSFDAAVEPTLKGAILGLLGQ
jgi:hypothetical protein